MKNSKIIAVVPQVYSGISGIMAPLYETTTMTKPISANANANSSSRRNGSRSSSRERQESPTQFLNIYFKIAYFFYLSPYKFVESTTSSTTTGGGGGDGRDNNGGAFVIRTSLPQKVICGLIQSFTLFRFCMENYESYKEFAEPSNDMRAKSYYSILMVTVGTTFIYKTVFVRTLWRSKELVLSILNGIREDDGGGRRERRWSQSQVHSASANKLRRFHIHSTCILLCSIYLLLATMCTFIWYKATAKPEMDPITYIRKSAAFARAMFFIYQNQTVKAGGGADPSYDIPAAGEYAWAFFYIFSRFCRQFVSFYTELFIVMSVLTFYYMSKSLTQFYLAKSEEGEGEAANKGSTKYSAAQIMEEYTKLKALADKISKLIGPVFLWFLLEGMGYYAISITNYFNVRNWMYVLRYTFFLFSFFTILLVSASVTSQVGRLENWLSESDNSSAFPSTSTLLILTSELNKNRVGINVMGLFTVTYGLIISVVGFMCTQAVIILQLKPE